MEKISVIIPAYNIEEYICGCLDSVLAQTYDDLEILVIDDGSRDGTGAIIDAYAGRNPRIKAIHKENGGVTSARLRGIDEATGDWIGFVDGDDTVEPEMFARLLENAEKAGADISHCGYRMVFPDRVDYYFNTGRYIEQDSRSALKELVSGTFEPGLWNKIFRRRLFSCLQEERAFDSSIRINEDLLMNFFLFRAAEKTVFEDFCPYYYQVRKGSATQSQQKRYMLEDPVKVRKIIMAECDDESLFNIAYESYLRCLIRVSTIAREGQSAEISAFIQQTHTELRNELPRLLKNQALSSKFKLQATWAALWPASYRFVHHIYGEATGINHKYEI